MFLCSARFKTVVRLLEVSYLIFYNYLNAGTKMQKQIESAKRSVILFRIETFTTKTNIGSYIKFLCYYKNYFRLLAELKDGC